MIDGRYRVLRRLGSGGIAEVYAAEDVVSGRRVAVKMIHAHLAEDAATLARFEREMAIAAMLRHPNLVRVLATGRDASHRPYAALEFVPGLTATEWIAADGAFSVRDAVDIVRQVLSGLAEAHAAGIVHRDLKPDNVLVVREPDGALLAKVFDFGVAAFVEAVRLAVANSELTPTGRAMGTPCYVSPEQFAGAAGHDPRVDIYAAGVLLYQLLAGRPPFYAEDIVELSRQVLHDDPAPLRVFRTDIPNGLEAVIRTAMSKNPEIRYPNAVAMSEALSAIPCGASEGAPGAANPGAANPGAIGTHDDR